jgi:hypothetical protein
VRKLDMILLSARANQNEPIGETGKAKLKVWRMQMELYARIAMYLAKEVDGLEILKGPMLQSFYPNGWLRVSRDLDMVVLTEAGLWHACEALERLGCVLLRATFIQHHSQLICSVHWAAPSQFPYDCHRHNFEISPILVFGDFISTACLTANEATHLLPAQRQILSILDEWHQRPFCARDAIDAQLVWEALSFEQRLSLKKFCKKIGLGIAWRNLCRKAGQMGLELGLEKFTIADYLTTTLKHYIAPLRTPFRALISRHHHFSPNTTTNVLNSWFASLSAERFLAAGSPVAGIRLNCPNQRLPKDRIFFLPSKQFSYVLCPIGVFALSPSSLIDDGFYQRAQQHFECGVFS